MSTATCVEILSTIENYCKKYRIPIEAFMDILEDQKVLPMIRGKATEYIAFMLLSEMLENDWVVTKLNLNPQQNRGDEDSSIRHRRTGRSFTIESKNAVKGSFRLGTSRTNIKAPHFKVKCHKSRSNLSRLTNDRYTTESFDIIVCNLSNALFGTNPIGGDLCLFDENEAILYLKDCFQIRNDDELIECAFEFWVCCFSRDVADPMGVIPRAPAVMFPTDEKWFFLKELPKRLDQLLIGRSNP